MARSTIDFTFAQLRDVEDAVARFCDALDAHTPGSRPLESLAREAYLSVLALAQQLYSAHDDDSTLALTRMAVHDLLDALAPYVTRADREARHVLLDGEPLEAALQRMYSA